MTEGQETAAARSPGNTLGRLFCLTLLTPIRPQWVAVLNAAMWLGKFVPFAQKHILQFNFIHFVRWSIVKEMPYNGPPQTRDRLKYQYLLFESNFDGPWQHYIDAFAYCIPADIRFVWGRGPAFPGPPPAEPLKRWIAMNSMEGGTYYCAYPHASTRMVKSALITRDRLKRLVAESRTAGPDEFMAHYEQFLTDLQAHL
ncbi:MAG: hypothetical protein ACHQSE_01080 [Gemmatimonadales bacterium]